MSRELRALRRRHGLACPGSSADPAHTLSARVPAPAQTLASVATQGRCGGEEQQGVAVGKGCLKRLGGVASGGGSGAAKKVSFASEPQVRVISPRAVVETTARRRGRGTLPSAQVGGGESLHQRRVQFGGGYSTAPVRRSMRNAANLGVEVEQVTVAVCNSVKFEDGGDAGETVDRKRKRKSRENNEHMFVSAQIGSGLLPEAPFVPPPVVEKKRARSKGPDVKEQTLEEQPAKVQNSGSTLNSEFITIGDAFAESKRNRRNVQEDEPAVQKPADEETSGRTTRSSSRAAAVMLPQDQAQEQLDWLRSRAVQGKNSVEEENHFVKKLENRRQPTKPATCNNSYQELASSVEEEYQEQVVALSKAPPLSRSSRNHSKASGLLLNNNTSCLSTHSAAKDDIEEDMSKKDGHLQLSWDGGAKDCDGTEEQMVQTVVRKGCLKLSGANVSSRSSGVAKKVTFKFVGQPAAEVAGFRRRPRVAADGEGDAGEAGSNAPLRWSRRNVVNVCAGDGVKRIAGAVSRKISATAHEEEEDVGEAVDRKPKASENVEDIGYVWLLPNIATPTFSQIMSATKSAANKMATKVVTSFGKKLSLYHVDHGAKKVG